MNTEKIISLLRYAIDIADAAFSYDEYIAMCNFLDRLERLGNVLDEDEDHTMVENTCKWLTRELCYTARGSNFFNNKTATDEFVEQFKQAMKGSNQ